MAKLKTLFKSKTRLYTNFCFGEHKEEFVISKSGVALKQVLENISHVLSENNFIEAVLQGGAAANLGFPSNIRNQYKLSLSKLNPSYIKWLKKYFQNPSAYLKNIEIIEDTDGSLGIDIDISIILSEKYIKEHLNLKSRKAFESRAHKLCALYNVIVGAKYLIFKQIQKMLSISPGLEVEDICDVHLVEYIINFKNRDIMLSELDVNLADTTIKSYLKILPQSYLVQN